MPGPVLLAPSFLLLLLFQLYLLLLSQSYDAEVLLFTRVLDAHVALVVLNGSLESIAVDQLLLLLVVHAQSFALVVVEDFDPEDGSKRQEGHHQEDGNAAVPCVLLGRKLDLVRD